MDLSGICIAQRQVVVDRGPPETLLEEILQPPPQGCIETITRQRDEDGDAPFEEVASDEELDLVTFLQGEESGERSPELLGRRSEQIVLRERLEQLDHRFVVVRALDEVFGSGDVFELSTENRHT